MAIEPERLASDFRSITPGQLLGDYAAGRRDFQGINLLRDYLDVLSPQIEERCYRPPAGGLRYGYWRDTVSPLWVDRVTTAPPAEFYEGAPVFHWEDDAFTCLLESNWEDQEDPCEVEVVDFTGAELDDINLQGAYIYRVSFAGASLERAKLQRAILVEVDMSRANLKSVDLRETVASGTRFREANLTGVRAERARLQVADFRGANLSRGRFRRANLAGSIWRGATMSRSRFSRNHLLHADLRGLDLTGVHFADSVISGCLIFTGQESALLDSIEVSRHPELP